MTSKAIFVGCSSVSGLLRFLSGAPGNAAARQVLHPDNIPTTARAAIQQITFLIAE